MTARGKQLKSVSGMLVSGALVATSAVMMIAIKTSESLPDCQLMDNIGWVGITGLSGFVFIRCLGSFLKAPRSGPDPTPPFEYRTDDRELPYGTRTDVVRDHGE